MGATKLTHVTTINPQNTTIHGPIVDEVEGLIKVYKDGHVERSHLIPCVGPSLPLELNVTCSDVDIDKYLWARLYVPMMSDSKVPLLVYFHGGGFCVGSASWLCYHEFLARLSAHSKCFVLSVNYRLAPENPLPAAYEDGVNTILWLKKSRNDNLWSKLCDFNRIFLAGDSAGGNIANHVAARLATVDLAPLKIEGTVLIQPFFGGEARTESEKRVGNNKSSVLTLAASDAWWRLSLPRGVNREHEYCKSVEIKSTVVMMRTLVCVAEMDLLMDRNMEMCDGNEDVIKRVVYRGVGHAFQILGKSKLAQTTSLEMLCHIDAFIHRKDSIN